LTTLKRQSRVITRPPRVGGAPDQGFEKILLLRSPEHLESATEVAELKSGKISMQLGIFADEKQVDRVFNKVFKILRDGEPFACE
jgi:hypothetical protein